MSIGSRRAISSLVCLFLVSAMGHARADDLVDQLSGKAMQWLKPLSSPSATRRLQQAGTLLNAARILDRKKDCRAVSALYARTYRLAPGGAPGVLVPLAKALQHCGQGERATQVAALGISKSVTPRGKQQATWMLSALLVHNRRASRKQLELAVALMSSLPPAARGNSGKAILVKARKRLGEISQLSLQDTRVRQRNQMPALCLDMNSGMPRPGEVDYHKFIQVQPAIDGEFYLGYSDEVCLQGARPGLEYKVTVRKGLKSREGRELKRGFSAEFKVPSLKPKAWFRNAAYVLPRKSGDGIPVYSVNAPRLELKLYRVNDRNLVGRMISGNFLTDISDYDTSNVANQSGELLWTGHLKPNGETNKEHRMVLSPEILGKTEPGLYVITAQAQSEDGKKSYGWRLATQWVVLTDMGLTLYKGPEEISAQVRGLADAKPMADVRVQLLARNNTVLAELKSGADGFVHVRGTAAKGKGGLQPARLLAYHGDDFALLNLSDTGFDLADRGSKGRGYPGPLEAYVYTERGVYRPGESVHLSALLRDDQAKAVAGLPLTLRQYNSRQELVREQIIKPVGAGGYTTKLKLAAGAPTGLHSARLYADTKLPPVGQVSFKVEEIRPPRLEAKVEAKQTEPLGADESRQLALKARYLFGAPGAELAVKVRVRPGTASNPFPQHAGFHFGVESEPKLSASWRALGATRTDDQGAATPVVKAPTLPEGTRPLELRVLLDVLDVDGRPASTAIALPLAGRAPYLGMRLQTAGSRFKEQTPAQVQVLAVDRAGKPVPVKGQSWRLFGEEWDFQWENNNGRWTARTVTFSHPRGKGELDIGPEPAELKFDLDAGRYRLELLDGSGAVRAMRRFTVGWTYAPGGADRPDQLQVRSDKSLYRAGDSARLSIEAPFEGQVSVVVAGRKLLASHVFPQGKHQREISIPVGKDWGVGAYALVTVYREAGKSHGPKRAVGLVWLGTDPAERELKVALDAPEEIEPGQVMQLPLSIQGADKGESVFLTLAAVDDGVLGLTAYKSPNPLAWYSTQRRLAVRMFDAYGRLIEGKGPMRNPRVGGGASLAREGRPDAQVEIVSLFSGVVQVGADGRASIPLQLPEYNGRLRLMAVAWSKDRMGAADGPLLVRRPVTLSPSLPNFLALNDDAEAAILVNNLSGPEGRYRVSAKATGALALGDAMSEFEFALAPGMREVLRLPVKGTKLGKGELLLTMTGPGGMKQQRTVHIGLRASASPISRRTLRRVQPGQELRLEAALFDGVLAEDARLSLVASSKPAWDVSAIYERLSLYPYGCLEQTTSRAWPLLDLAKLKAAGAKVPAVPLPQRIAMAIDKVLEKQRVDGGFGLWSWQDQGDAWLTAYAMDFLLRAKATGHKVPPHDLERGVRWLERSVQGDWPEQPRALAGYLYAQYLLARSGKARPDDLRYFAGGNAELPTPLSAAQLGAALALIGEKQMALAMFDKAAEIKRKSVHDYGSRLRDYAALVALAEESSVDTPRLAEWVQNLAELQGGSPWLSTQEQAWLLRAAVALGSPGDESLDLSLDGIRLKGQGKVSAEPVLPARGAGMSLINNGKSPLWLGVSLRGTPDGSVPEPVTPTSLKVERALYTLDGKRIDGALQVGDIAVVVIKGRAHKKQHHQAMVVDRLPAGLIIDNPSLEGAMKLGKTPWLGKLSRLRYSEALEDRYVAALDLGANQKFKIAYLVRAVTAGQYAAPAVLIEDMYKPRYRGQGEPGRLLIEPVGK